MSRKARKSINVKFRRTGTSTHIWRWLSNQSNKHQALVFLISGAINKFGYKDLQKYIPEMLMKGQTIVPNIQAQRPQRSAPQRNPNKSRPKTQDTEPHDKHPVSKPKTKPKEPSHSMWSQPHKTEQDTSSDKKSNSSNDMSTHKKLNNNEMKTLF